MTDFAAGLVAGAGLSVLALLAFAAVLLSAVDRHQPEPVDDPYRALYAAASRPALHTPPLEVHDVA